MKDEAAIAAAEALLEDLRRALLQVADKGEVTYELLRTMTVLQMKASMLQAAFDAR